MCAPKIGKSANRKQGTGTMSSSNEALHDQPDWLRVTLSRSGYDVITTDSQVAVTFLNPVDRSLVNWTEERALGVLAVAFSPPYRRSATRPKHQPQHLRIPVAPNKAQEEQAAIESLNSIFHLGAAVTTVPVSHRSTVIDGSVLRCTARRL